jgi:hypothetical protein
LGISHSSDQLTALEIILYSSILNNEYKNNDQTKSVEVIVSEPVVTISSKVNNLKSTAKKKRTDFKDQNIDFNKIWDQTLENLRIEHSTLYSIIKRSEVQFINNTIVLRTGYSFHQKALNHKKNRDMINEQLLKICGVEYPIEAIIDENIKDHIATDEGEAINDLDITSISNIFGGGEVVE